MGGEGVVLEGPVCDQRPQRRVGGEGPMVTVTVDPRRWKDLGEAVKELEGREAEAGAAGQVGLREEIEDLVGAVADEVESVEGEGGPGTVADEAFEAGTVGGLNADAGVQTEPPAVLPGEHILGFVGLQEPVAVAMPQDPGADRVLEALQDLGGEGRGFVKTEVGGGIGWVLSRVTLNLFEKSIDHAQMIMEVWIEGGAEAMQKADGPERGVGWCGGTGLPQGGLESPQQDVEEGPQPLGDGEHELAHRHVGNDVINEVGRRLGHALGVAGRTGTSALAGKRHQKVIAAA